MTALLQRASVGSGSWPSWRPIRLATARRRTGQSGVLLTLSGSGILNAPAVLAGIDGITSIRQLDEDPDCD